MCKIYKEHENKAEEIDRENEEDEQERHAVNKEIYEGMC